MRNKENICKFVSGYKADAIETINFVFEKNAPKVASMRMNAYNTMYLVVSGSGRLVTENHVKQLSAGNLFFTFGQVPFKIENTGDICYMYISFKGERSEELLRRFAVTPNNCMFTCYESLIALWQNSLAKAGQQNLDLISESVLLYSFSEMCALESAEKQLLIDDVLKYIGDNFSDSELNLENVSNTLGYNSKYISHAFKMHMGISFSQYLTNMRIQHAVFLMEQGVTAIKNVAMLSGYKDPFYFSNVFKKLVGVSPKEFLVQAKNK